MTTLINGPRSGLSSSNYPELVWEHERFASVFRNVLTGYAQRSILEGEPNDDVVRHHERVEILDRAIKSRDIDLIVTCHQYLLSTALPSAVETAFHVMKPMIPIESKVSSIIKMSHINFCEQVITLFPFEYGMTTTECYGVIALGFEDISKAQQIITAIEVGATGESEIRSALYPRHERGKVLRTK